jgi:hypothetical protein
MFTLRKVFDCNAIQTTLITPYNPLEISTRGHEYEKGYRIKNVVTFLRRQFPGKRQCWYQIWHPKSGIHVLRICVESLVQIGTIFFYNFDLWPSMTLTLTKFDLTEINPPRAIPYHVLWNWGPKDVGEKQMWPLGPNDLDLCRTNP